MTDNVTPKEDRRQGAERVPTARSRRAAGDPILAGPADVWGAGAPVATALAEALRPLGVDATCVDSLGGRLGGPAPALIFPVFGGRAGEDAGLRRHRLVGDAVRLAAALAEGQLSRLIVLGSTAAYGTAADGRQLSEDSPLAAAEGGTAGADARAVEAILSGRRHVTVLRHAELLGPGCGAGLLARHLDGPRLLVVRGTSPVWQVCHLQDLARALALVLSLPPSALDGPAVVASSGTLSQVELEEAAGRRRLELPMVVAEATAARLQRTRLAPGASEELPYLAWPCVVAPVRLAALGFAPQHTAAAVIRDQVGRDQLNRDRLNPTQLARDQLGGVQLPGERHDTATTHPQAVRLAGATVAAVGSAALLRRARRSRGR